LTIDASELRWASPADLTAIAAVAAAESEGLHLNLPSDVDVAQYLRRMRVIEVVERAGGTTSGPTTDSTVNDLPDRLLELRGLQGEDVSTFASDVFRLVNTHADHTSAQIFHTMLGELLANTKEHGRSPVGAFGAAQVHSGATSGRPGVEVAIADVGVGVLESLRTNPRHADLSTSASALQAALRQGVSSHTEDFRGNGLSRVTSQLRAHGGRLILRSGDGVARVSRTGRKFANTRTATPGTWAWLWIDLAVSPRHAQL
jgi:hypothetical protein